MFRQRDSEEPDQADQADLQLDMAHKGIVFTLRFIYLICEWNHVGIQYYVWA